MLSTDTLNAFAKRDTRVVATALMQGSLLGTEIGDRVLAAVGNYPERFDALVSFLREHGAWESAA